MPILIQHIHLEQEGARHTFLKCMSLLQNSF